MAATKYDFNIERGSSFRITFSYKNSDGDPIDLNNWCAQLIWTSDTGDNYTFSTDNVDYSLYTFSINDSVGDITLTIPASITNTYNFKTAKYDLDLKSPEVFSDGGDNYITRILYGNICIIQRYSNSGTDSIC